MSNTQEQDGVPVGPPYLKKVTYPATALGIVKEVVGNQIKEAFMFIEPDGTAHVFPFDDKKEIVRALTGGVEIASSIDLPPGVRA